MTEYTEGGPRYDVKVIFDGAYLQAEQDNAVDPEWEAACEVHSRGAIEVIERLLTRWSEPEDAPYRLALKLELRRYRTQPTASKASFVAAYLNGELTDTPVYVDSPEAFAVKYDGVLTAAHSSYSVGASGVEPIPKRHARDHEPQWESDGESSYCIICGREPGPGE